MQALPVRAGGKLQLAGIALPGNERQVIKGGDPATAAPLQLIERQRRAVGVAARQFDKQALSTLTLSLDSCQRPR